MKILFVGDIVGKPGRAAVKKLLPGLRTELHVDVVIANVENLAHGKGLSKGTWQEVRDAGVDIGTGGNHSLSKPEGEGLFADATYPFVVPQNMPGVPNGQGLKTFTVSGKTVTVINLLGEMSMFPAPVDSPFHAMSRTLSAGLPASDATIVDFHAEATSEKINMGWYLDGKVTAVIGTHTHVQTADERVLLDGTGYISDVGMVGLRDGSLGVDRAQALNRFLEGGKAPFEIPDHGIVEFRAVLLTIENKKTISIERIVRSVEV